MQYDDFTEQERRTLLLIRCYEDTRRQHGQYGYRVFADESLDPRQHKQFKSFQVVVAWLLEKGWVVTWKEVHWIGYVKHVFAQMKPHIPFPGQLKNEMFLRDYLGSTTVNEEATPERTPEELERIYGNVIDARIRTEPKAMAALGVKRV